MLRRLIFVISLFIMMGSCDVAYAANANTQEKDNISTTQKKDIDSPPIDPVKHIKMGIVVIGLIVTMVTIVAIAGLFFDALQMVKFKIYIGILSVVIVLGALFYYILGLYTQIQDTIKAVT